MKKKNKLEQPTLLNKIIAVPFYLKLLRKYNKLETEYEVLLERVKGKTFEKCLKQVELDEHMDFLEKENLRLKERIKHLKED